ncbi:MAG TPA: hypothetical protein VM841_06590, partial [Actinomycetota bacterium]|nr:hypothetical protein [Actinomycetota bacterium]
MGEKGLSGAAGDEEYRHAGEPAAGETDAPDAGSDERVWQPDYEPVPAYASDDAPHADQAAASDAGPPAG